MNIEGLEQNVPLAPFTTFKIGGPATYFVKAHSADEMVHALTEARKENIPTLILGGGSDILIADKGFDGLVIKTDMKKVYFDDAKQTVQAGAGMLLTGLIAQTLKHNLAGLEFAIGVPASVGGAVWANLGARGSEIADVLLSATIIDEKGHKRELRNEECIFSYRESIFKHKDWTIIDATFQLRPGDKDEMKALVKELSSLRSDTQDVGAKTAGCAFRNPADQTDEAAAKLIDDLGLKGKTIGGAQVSEKHANFIINTGTATADDVAQLISLVKQQVRDKKGIQLQEEVEYIGFE